MAEGHSFLFFIFYFFYCPALPLPLPCPVSNFPFAARDRRRKLHMELFFLFLPGTGGGSYTLHYPPGSAIEYVTGLCRTYNPVTDRHHIVAFIYKIFKIKALC
jgi:hypothetical protein